MNGMKHLDKTKEVLINELQDLQQQYNSLKAAYDKDLTERKQAEEALRDSEEKYRTIFENVQDVFYQTDLTGIIREISPSIKYFSEFNREELIGSSVYETYYQGDDRDALLNEIIKNGEIKDYELRLKTKTGKLKHVSINARLISDAVGRPDHIDGAIRDITKRKLAEEAMLHSEASLAEAQQIAHIGSWEWDMISDIMKLSNEMYRVLDLHPENFDGKSESLIKVFHPDDAKSFIDGMKVNLSGGNLPSMEYRVIHRDGSIHTLSAKSRIEFNEAGKPVRSIGTAQDITVMSEQEFKSTLEQMRQLTQYIEKVREDERVAISRELHDDLGQALTAVKIDLGIIRQNVPDKEVVLKINKLSALVSETIKTVQRITSQLRPELLDDLGLEAAIEWYTKEYAKRNGVKVILDMDPGIECSPNVSLHIFRIMQEALTNIARHSGAARIDIRLSKTGNFLNFRISDNGIGINENEIKSKTSFGIISMKERATSIGGTLEVYNENDSGTVIKLAVPLNNP